MSSFKTKPEFLGQQPTFVFFSYFSHEKFCSFPGLSPVPSGILFMAVIACQLTHQCCSYSKNHASHSASQGLAYFEQWVSSLQNSSMAERIYLAHFS